MNKRHAGLIFLVLCGSLLVWLMRMGLLCASEPPHPLPARVSTVKLCAGDLQALSLSPARGLAAGSPLSQGSITIWDMEGKTLRVIGHDGHSAETASLLFSADGALLAAAPSKGFVRIYSMTKGGEVCALPWFEGTSSLAFSPSGALLAVGGRDGSIKLWEIARRRVVQVIMAHDYFVSALAFSPDGALLASSSWDRSVKLWKLPSGTFHRVFRQGGAPALLLPSFPGIPGKDAPVPRKEQPLATVAFSPDGAFCASGAQDGLLFIWSVSSGELVNKIEGAHHSICSLAYSSEGDLLACGLDDGSLVMAAPSSKDKAVIIPAHKARVQFIAFTDHDRCFCSASTDGSVITWSLSPGQEPSPAH